MLVLANIGVIVYPLPYLRRRLTRGFMTDNCKVGGRDILLDVAPIAWGEATELASSQAASRSPLLRKLLVKLIQRIGNTYLPPRVASWRYMACSLSYNIYAASTSDG